MGTWDRPEDGWRGRCGLAPVLLTTHQLAVRYEATALVAAVNEWL
ncbi:hypothetical protein ACIBO9_39550 [Streptomyces prunicolor]